MATCVVKDCNTALDESSKYFKFPRSRLLRKAWLNAVPVVSEITTDTFVCGKHFTDDDFEVIKSKRVLRTHAVPRIYDTPNTQKEEEIVTKSEIEDNDTNNETQVEETKSSEEEIASQVKCDEGEVGLVKAHSGNECQNDKQELDVKNDSKQQEQNKPEDNDPKDIEEIIKHYHIRQDISKRNRDKCLNGDNSTGELPPNPFTDRDKCFNGDNSTGDLPPNPFTHQSNIFSDLMEASKNQSDIAKFNYQLSAHQVEFISDLVEKLAPNTNQRGVEIQPKYVEVSTRDKTVANRSDSPQDCYMLLENVQVELDPSNFFHDDEDEIHDVDRDDEQDLVKQKQDEPISLVTSSDEDDVIIQEPHIDTVEVSDETDEDDMPLVRLLKPKKKKNKSLVNPMASIWGVQYQCKECEYRTTDISSYNIHSRTHIYLRVCELCNYTTSSKVQYVRHKRKHKEEKRFKCHLCGYTAKHNMSLVYHLKTHSAKDGKSESVFNCEKCNFKSTNMYKYKTHTCLSGVKWHNCARCSYTTRRRSDLRRHSARMHSEDDADEWVPP